MSVTFRTDVPCLTGAQRRMAKRMALVNYGRSTKVTKATPPPREFLPDFYQFSQSRTPDKDPIDVCVDCRVV